MSLVVIYSPKNPLTSNELALVDQFFPSALIAVIGRSAGEEIIGQRISFFGEDALGLSQFETFIASMDISHILFRPGGFWDCKRDILAAVLSSSIPTILSFTDFLVEEYRFVEPKVGVTESVLFVYPGPLAPTNNGSRQRALSLFFEILASGKNVTLAVNKRTLEKQYENFLRQFGVKIILFEGSKSVQNILKYLRAKFKNMLGGGYFLPLFARLEFSLSPGYRALIDRHSTSTETVIFSYAWMVPFFLKRKRNVKYIIDTHDVNFVRDSVYYQGKGKVGNFLDRFGRKLERKLLKSVDKVVAISSADYEIFRSSDLGNEIIVTPPSFDWVDTVHGTGNVKATTFGFIGADMIANRKAVDHIFNKVWPIIHAERPDARLFIAGNICKYVDERKNNIVGVTCLGFVMSLRGFYSSIDALISPVLMQGGLNIKIMESLVSGVPVYVNSLGAKSLPETGLVYVGEDEPTLKGVQSFLADVDGLVGDMDQRREMSEAVKKGADASFRIGYTRMFS